MLRYNAALSSYHHFRMWMCSAPQKTLWKQSQLTSNLLHFLLKRPARTPEQHYGNSAAHLSTMAASSLMQTPNCKALSLNMICFYICVLLWTILLLSLTSQYRKLKEMSIFVKCEYVTVEIIFSQLSASFPYLISTVYYSVHCVYCHLLWWFCKWCYCMKTSMWGVCKLLRLIDA